MRMARHKRSAVRSNLTAVSAVQTRSWLVDQAARLVRLRRLLEGELHKFTNVTITRERYVRHYDQNDGLFFNTHNPVDPKYASRGQMCLRRLIEEVRMLDVLLHPVANHECACVARAVSENLVVRSLCSVAKAHTARRASHRFSQLQVEELRIRLAQFRRTLPCYGRGGVPRDGIYLTARIHSAGKMVARTRRRGK